MHAAPAMRRIARRGESLSRPLKVRCDPLQSSWPAPFLFSRWAQKAIIPGRPAELQWVIGSRKHRDRGGASGSDVEPETTEQAFRLVVRPTNRTEPGGSSSRDPAPLRGPAAHASDGPPASPPTMSDRSRLCPTANRRGQRDPGAATPPPLDHDEPGNGSAETSHAPAGRGRDTHPSFPNLLGSKHLGPVARSPDRRTVPFRQLLIPSSGIAVTWRNFVTVICARA